MVASELLNMEGRYILFAYFIVIINFGCKMLHSRISLGQMIRIKFERLLNVQPIQMKLCFSDFSILKEVVILEVRVTQSHFLVEYARVSYAVHEWN